MIHSCFKKSGGAVRVIDSSVTNCGSGETSLNWNQAGAQGEPGPAGVSGYEIVTEAQTEDTTGFFGAFTATCPDGKKVLGGGGSALTSDGGVSNNYLVLNDFPTGDNAWQATFNISNPLGDTFVMTTYAVCANVS